MRVGEACLDAMNSTSPAKIHLIRVRNRGNNPLGVAGHGREMSSGGPMTHSGEPDSDCGHRAVIGLAVRHIVRAADG